MKTLEKNGIAEQQLVNSANVAISFDQAVCRFDGELRVVDFVDFDRRCQCGRNP